MAMTMRRYLDDHGINVMFQSAYRPNHSIKTALVKIFNYISLAGSGYRDEGGAMLVGSERCF